MSAKLWAYREVSHAPSELRISTPRGWLHIQILSEIHRAAQSPCCANPWSAALFSSTQWCLYGCSCTTGRWILTDLLSITLVLHPTTLSYLSLFQWLKEQLSIVQNPLSSLFTSWLKLVNRISHHGLLHIIINLLGNIIPELIIRTPCNISSIHLCIYIHTLSHTTLHPIFWYLKPYSMASQSVNRSRKFSAQFTIYPGLRAAALRSQALL